MRGPFGAGQGAGMFTFVMHVRIRKARRERHHRVGVEAAHHRQQNGGIDAARQEHAVRHVGALVHAHTVIEHVV